MSIELLQKLEKPTHFCAGFMKFIHLMTIYKLYEAL